MMFAPLEGRRHVKVTDRHTAVDYARALKELADIYFAHAKTIVLVQDNLSIHSKASLYEAFPAVEVRRLVERFEWHYTPKHGSWLNLAESELGVPSASTAAFPTNKSSSTKLPPGSTTAMQTTPRPTGNSPPKMLASNLSIYTLQSE
ncbi:MAG TPA: transposase [Xanthobacteraceae bacterium]|nr:transposase [Xanthobacteraceae bacterium]